MNTTATPDMGYASELANQQAYTLAQRVRDMGHSMACDAHRIVALMHTSNEHQTPRQRAAFLTHAGVATAAEQARYELGCLPLAC